MTQEPDPALAGRSRWHMAVFAALCVSSVLSTRYLVTGPNHELQLPLVQHLLDPGLFVDDPYVATLSHYASPYWHFVAFLSRWVAIDWLLPIGFVCVRAAAIAAGGSLAAAVAPRVGYARYVGWVLVAMGPRALVGMGTLVPSYLEHTGTAIVFVIWALSSYLRGRVVLAGVALGLAALCNVIYGVFAATFLLALAAPNWREHVSSAARRKTTMLALFSAAALTLPAALTLATTREPASDVELWYAALEAYYPGHFFPHAWSIPAIGGQCALVALVVVWAKRLEGTGAAQAWTLSYPRIRAISLCWASWMLLCVVGAYVVRLPELVVVFPARATDIYLILAGTWLVLQAAEQLQRGRATAGAASKGLSRLALWAVIAAAVTFMGWLTSAGWLALWLGVFWLPGRIRPSWSVHPASALVLAVLVQGAASGAIAVAKDGAAGILRTDDPTMADIENWARENTPIDSVFVVDPAWGHFRTHASRTPYVTWKEGAALMWYPPFAATWVGRLADLGVNLRRFSEPPDNLPALLRDAYDELDADRLDQLTARGADYWIAPADTSAAPPIAHQNSEYRVFRLGGHRPARPTQGPAPR